MFRNLLSARVLLPLAALTALSAFAACSGDDDDVRRDAANGSTHASAGGNGETEAPTSYANPELLVGTSDLNAAIDDPNVAIIDVRKREAYDDAHIPGAVWYDSSKLKDPDDELYVIRDSLFAEYMGEIGVDGSKHVVVYDDGNGLIATRLWWVLWYYGHEDAAVLNGGWAKWQKDGLPTSSEAPLVTRVSFQPRVNDAVICALDYVEEKATDPDPNVVILDVRSPAEYSGADVRARKGGHVPNAINLDWTRSLTDSDPTVWKPAQELHALFSAAGLQPGQEVITYCQTGVRAAHALFTLKLMGYESVRNFDGSWQEWGNNKDTPVER